MEQIATRSKKVRGRSQATLELAAAMFKIAEEMQPITGRGIGYKLFTQGLLDDMSKGSMQRVYRVLLQEREEGRIPWPWIVDEHRTVEQVPQWDDPEAFAEHMLDRYSRDYWEHQPVRVEVWSEKGTVSGVLDPVICSTYVPLRVFHGFSGATSVNDVAADADRRPLVAIYVGDFDPSGMFMSEVDLPQRLERYGGDHVIVKRVAVEDSDRYLLPTFDAKLKDPRYKWFCERYGKDCVELDALDPRDLRDRVRREIEANILDRDAWDRCKAVEEAERSSLEDILWRWKGAS